LREFWSTVAGGRGTVTERSGYRSVLDLGTEQTKALVLELKGEEGLVVGVGRAPCQSVEWVANVDDSAVRRMARSCDQALREAEDMAAEICDERVVPDCVVVGLPNYLTIAEVFAVTHHRSTPAKRINDRELREVVERAQRLALQQLGRKAEPLQIPREMRVELLEAAISGIRIDGHGVTDPVGFPGENLAVAVFNVVVLSSHLRAVESIAEDLGLEILSTISGWQALASALGKRDGICIDVGGKATDVVLVRNGKAWGTASLPFGGSDFTKCLGETLGLSWKDAESLKLAFSRGRIESLSRADVGEAVKRVMEIWLGGVEATLSRVSSSQSLPHQFNLCGGGSALPALVDIMRSHHWMPGLAFSRHPQVRLMQPREVPRILDRTGQLGGQEDVAPLALARYSMTGDTELDSLERLLWRVKRPEIFGSTGGRA
jgi:cell division ATPase FtsA